MVEHEHDAGVVQRGDGLHLGPQGRHLGGVRVRRSDDLDGDVDARGAVDGAPHGARGALPDGLQQLEDTEGRAGHPGRLDDPGAALYQVVAIGQAGVLPGSSTRLGSSMQPIGPSPSAHQPSSQSQLTCMWWWWNGQPLPQVTS